MCIKRWEALGRPKTGKYMAKRQYTALLRLLDLLEQQVFSESPWPPIYDSLFKLQKYVQNRIELAK